MTSLSTHVLDTALGRPARGVRVTLFRVRPDTRWQQLAAAVTDADGRVREFEVKEPLAPGEHRLVFDTGAYYATRGGESFYPRVTVDFEMRAGEHHHVPLLLSPFGYSTYRGS